MLERVVHQTRGETAVKERQCALVQLFIERQGGVGVVLRHCADDLQRKAACRHPIAHRRCRSNRRCRSEWFRRRIRRGTLRRIGALSHTVRTGGCRFCAELSVSATVRLFCTIKWTLVPTANRMICFRHGRIGTSSTDRVILPFRRHASAITRLIFARHIAAFPTKGTIAGGTCGVVPTEAVILARTIAAVSTKATVFSRTIGAVSTKVAILARMIATVSTEATIFVRAIAVVSTEAAILTRAIAAVSTEAATAVRAIAAVAVEAGTISVIHGDLPLSILLLLPSDDRADNRVMPSACRRAPAFAGCARRFLLPRR